MKWNKGAPPHPGWFLSRLLGVDEKRWRWFDGNSWSFYVREESGKEFAGDRALKTAGQWHIDKIIWSYYYPKNARVPRINPNKKVKK